jgi:hypothetical protein
MTQLALRFETGRTVKSPICAFVTHCGALCEVGPREDWPGGFNERLTCLRCGRIGEWSSRRENDVHA